MTFRITPRTFHFIHPATTSRGVYHERESWLVQFFNHHGLIGTGECAPLPDLSWDASPHYAEQLAQACEQFVATGTLPTAPSMRFGIETALQTMPHTPWTRGQEGIPINGLVWMGSVDEMTHRLNDKIATGYRCIKLKIGSYVDDELALLAYAHKHSPATELRVDANGAFRPDEAPDLLRELAQLGIHSIEQPIRANQWSEMAKLCKTSPVPIALDEELIGIHTTQEKLALIEQVRPQYLVLKPSLHGGISGTEEWVALARKHHIGSWITSALESNTGLQAIALLADKLYGPHITMAQGLGTGQLFKDNIESSLTIRGCALWNK